MKTEKTNNQAVFDLHIEYSQEIPKHDKEMRALEDKFQLAFGFPIVPLDNWAFSLLEDTQQQAIIAFWKHPKVVTAKRNVDRSRMLADLYFTNYINTNGI